MKQQDIDTLKVGEDASSPVPALRAAPHRPVPAVMLAGGVWGVIHGGGCRSGNRGAAAAAHGGWRVGGG